MKKLKDENKTIIIKRGENRSVILSAGDGEGCERPHWRDPMPTEYKRTWYGKKVEKNDFIIRRFKNCPLTFQNRPGRFYSRWRHTKTNEVLQPRQIDFCHILYLGDSLGC